MTDQFRALCAELVDDLELCDWPYKLKGTIRADIERARALLAEPVAEGPTDDEIHDFIALWWQDFGNGYLPCSSDEPLVKAALARWCRQPARLRYCPTHGQQPPEAWGCPDCVRELREELAASLHPTPAVEGEVADEELREIAMHCVKGHKSIEWAIKEGIALDRSRRAAAPVPEPGDEALANFTAWFCRNYPGPDTLIHRPEWHAPKVFRAAADAIARWGRPAAAPVPEPVAVSELGQQPVSQPYRLLLLGEVGA